MPPRYDRPAGIIALLVTVALVILIVAGSRNLKTFDAALIGYAVATVLAVLGITYRFVCWLSRPRRCSAGCAAGSSSSPAGAGGGNLRPIGGRHRRPRRHGRWLGRLLPADPARPGARRHRRVRDRLHAALGVRPALSDRESAGRGATRRTTRR